MLPDFGTGSGKFSFSTLMPLVGSFDLQNCLLDNLYCVGGDVKPCSINQSRIQPFFGNPAKFMAGFDGCQYSSQCVQFITDKISAADLLSGVFATLIAVTRRTKIQNLLCSTNFIKTVKQWRNKELYCLFTTADSIVHLFTLFISSGISLCNPKSSIPQIWIWIRPDLSS